MRIKVLAHTPNIEKVIAEAAHLCCSNGTIEDGQEKRLIGQLREMGHMSPFEHASITFGIFGVSRALTHQLVRHRVASFSQQSQRYVSVEDAEFICPPSISNNEKAVALWNMWIETSRNVYASLCDLDIPQEDARYVVPNACESKLYMTMNCRELLHFFEERCCGKAQWEIRQLAKMLLDACKSLAPNVFMQAGPKCKRLGVCPERHSCGACSADTVYDRFAALADKCKENGDHIISGIGPVDGEPGKYCACFVLGIHDKEGRIEFICEDTDEARMNTLKNIEHMYSIIRRGSNE